MDPDTTLNYIHDCLVRGGTDAEADDACENLYDWLSKGGFEPVWGTYPAATAYYLDRYTSGNLPLWEDCD